MLNNVATVGSIPERLRQVGWCRMKTLWTLHMFNSNNNLVTQIQRTRSRLVSCDFWTTLYIYVSYDSVYDA
jgi:hypothetical protein